LCFLQTFILIPAVLVGKIFSEKNSIYPLNDANEMAAYLCAQAALSPVARMVNAAAEWLGKRVLDNAQGEDFLRALVGSNLSGFRTRALIGATSRPGSPSRRSSSKASTANYAMKASIRQYSGHWATPVKR
jgi:hypothetical protein